MISSVFSSYLASQLQNLKSMKDFVQPLIRWLMGFRDSSMR